MNNTGKLKFKKEKEKPKLRDSLIFVLIFVLCIATVVTIQIKSQQKKETETSNAHRIESEPASVSGESEPVSAELSDRVIAEPKKDDDAQRAQLNSAKGRKNEESKEELPKQDIPASTGVVKEEVNKQETNKQEEAKKLEFISPLGEHKGDVIKKFSSRELIYSKTLDDWRLHFGVDISSPIGTAVVSCEDGTVEEILDDDGYGTTVVIKHNDRFRTKYSNLAGQYNVTVGEKIKKGQQIGVVGDTSSNEILDEAHLHFEMSENDALINPEKYIKF